MADPIATDKSAFPEQSLSTAASRPVSPSTPAAAAPVVPAAPFSAAPVTAPAPWTTGAPWEIDDPVTAAAPSETAAPVTTASPGGPTPNSAILRDSRVKPLKLLLLLIVFAITGVGSLMLLASAMKPQDAGTSTNSGAPLSAARDEPLDSARDQPHAAAAPPASGAAANRKVAGTAAKPTVDAQDSIRKSKWIVSANSRKAGYGASMFELAAEEDVEVWRKHVRPVLTMRCAARTTEVFVATQSPAAPEGQSNLHTIKVRFDDREPIEQTWEHSIDHDALFSQNGVAMMHQIAGAKRMTFSWAPFNAPPATATFSVEGFDAHRKAAASRCRS